MNYTKKSNSKGMMKLLTTFCLALLTINAANASETAKKAAKEETAKKAAKEEKNRAVKRMQGRAIGVHKKIMQRVKQGAPEVIMLGDSITECWCWKPRGLPAWENYYGKYKPINMGISGDRAEHLLWRIQDGTLDGLKPKVAVLMIGANNISGKPLDTALTIKQILAEMRKRLPETKILMLEILPVGKEPMKDKHNLHHQKINDIIRPYADGKWIHRLDISKTFLDDKGNLRMELMQDSWHPNKKGYEAWGAAMAPTLKKLLGE